MKAKAFCILFILAFSSYSCIKDQPVVEEPVIEDLPADEEEEQPAPPKPKNDEAVMTSLSFTSEANASLKDDIDAYFRGSSLRFSVPEEMYGSKVMLVPKIVVSENAAVTINGRAYLKGVSYDFKNGADIVVKSESEVNSKTYSVVCEAGDNFIDKYIWKLMDECHIPGVSLSVMKGTTPAYSKGYGVADQETGEKVTPDHLFRVASISKQFCALCIMTLKEQGRLNLDDKVFGDAGILKGLYKNVTSYHKSITVRHLLSHSSGICKGLSDPAFTDSYRFFNDWSGAPVPVDTLIQRTLNARQNSYDSYSPGFTYDYSNVGYCILHRVVEVVSGKSYETFLKEDVLAGMGITDTHIGGKRYERRENECVYYSQGDANGYENPLKTIAGAAGIITSTNQMMRFLTYVDGDETVPDVLSSESLGEMYSPYPYLADSYRGYGLGWNMNNSRRFKGAHFHGGNMAGTAAMWVGGAIGDDTRTFSQPMSGAIVCNSRSYGNSITWDTSWGSSSHNDIDDSFYIILAEAFIHFSK